MNELSGAPIGDARVSAGDVSCATMADGQCDLAADFRSDVLVQASGYLDRKTTPIRIGARLPAVARLTLWPVVTPAGVSVQTTRELLFTPPESCCSSSAGTVGLRRLMTSFTTGSSPNDLRVGFGAELGDMSAANSSLLRAAAEASRLTGDRPPFSMETRNAVRLILRAGLIPGESRVAVRLQYAGGVVNGAEVIYPDAEVFRRKARAGELTASLVHMFGHVIGFGHTSRSGMVMGPGDPTLETFSEGEFDYARLLFSRLPGTRFPDDETNVTPTPGPALVYCDRVPR